MVNGCYTEKELDDILAGARCYDEISEQQRIRDEQDQTDAVKQATPSMRWAADLYKLFEKENIGFISEAHREIGTLRAVKERFADNDHILQWCDYFIRCALCEIDELMDEVNHERETARELARV